MSASLIRLGILASVALIVVILVLAGRLFVARQRRLALAAQPLTQTPDENAAPSSGKVRVLAFSSADCTQCHTLQQPALRQLKTLLGEEVEVVEIDAPSSPELTRRYRILTVPSTVVLDRSGEAREINYGFANMGKLRAQVGALLTPAHTLVPGG
jgi:hypothetical protein